MIDIIEKINNYKTTPIKKGDFVLAESIVGIVKFDAIVYCELPDEYWVLDKTEKIPRKLNKSEWVLIKTGKHIDLDKLFD